MIYKTLQKKNKDWATRIPLKTDDEVNSSDTKGVEVPARLEHQQR